MNELAALQSAGLELPSPAYLFGTIVFSLIGFMALRWGRVRERKLAIGLGIALMVYPYAVSSTWLLYLIGTALCAGLLVTGRD